MRMCSPPFHSSLNRAQRDMRLSLVLWKALLVAQPCLALPQFRLHTWHSERGANPSSHAATLRGGGEGGREEGYRLRVSRAQRDRTGENRKRKGTNLAVGCDRKINTYNVQSS